MHLEAGCSGLLVVVLLLDLERSWVLVTLACHLGLRHGLLPMEAALLRNCRQTAVLRNCLYPAAHAGSSALHLLLRRSYLHC
jgi:hypothetical protein